MSETEINKLFSRNSRFAAPSPLFEQMKQNPIKARRQSVKPLQVESNSRFHLRNQLMVHRKEASGSFNFSRTMLAASTEKENTRHFASPPSNQLIKPRNTLTRQRVVMKPAFKPSSTQQLKSHVNAVKLPVSETRSPQRNINQTALISYSKRNGMSPQKKLHAPKLSIDFSRFNLARPPPKPVSSRWAPKSAHRDLLSGVKRPSTTRKVEDDDCSISASSTLNRSCSKFIQLVEETFGVEADGRVSKF